MSITVPMTVPGSFRWRQIENAVSITVLAAMAALPLLEIGLRELTGRSIPGTIPAVQHLTLMITFLGAALATKAGRMLAMATTTFLPESLREKTGLMTSALGAAVAATLCVASLDLVRVERELHGVVAWGIPAWAIVAVMPLGFGLISLRLVWNASTSWHGRLIAIIALSIPAAFWLMPAAPGYVTAGVLILLLAATALGLPIFATLGGLALMLFWADGVPIAAVPVETYRLSATPMLPAIPLFTLSGFLMAEAGAGQRLMRIFSAMLGWMPGSLAIVTTLVLAFFTPLTGASGVTILSMGGFMLPLLVKAGYPQKSSMGLVTVSGSIGLLLPPSLPVILYAISAQIPIDSLFIGALVPGLLLMVVVAGWGAFTGVSAGVARTPFDWRETINAGRAAVWELLLPVVVLVGIFGGFMTLVESAAVTVFYAVIVECFIYRDLSVRRDLPRITVECVTLVGGFLIILGMALGFTNYMVQAEIPMQVLAWVQAHIASKLVFLLALNLFLILVGALMDIYSAILVVVPLIVPVAAVYGIDPVHLGVIFLANMELGYLMPPMGENLFLSSYRFKKPLSEIYRSTLPFLILLFITVLLITYVPFLTLGLVK